MRGVESEVCEEEEEKAEGLLILKLCLKVEETLCWLAAPRRDCRVPSPLSSTEITDSSL